MNIYQQRLPIGQIMPTSAARAGVCLMLVSVLLAAGLLVFTTDHSDSLPLFFLVPWSLALGAVLLAPIGWLYYKGRFHFADPIVFGTLSYIFPAFVLGGLVLASGLSDPYYLSYIVDAEYNLPLTLGVVALGFAGLAGGYLSPIGVKLGRHLSRVLPESEHAITSYLIPAYVLLGLGVMNTVVAFAFGLFGFQTAREVTDYDQLVYLSTVFRTQALFVLLLVVFRSRRLTPSVIITLGLVLAVSLATVLFAGSRGAMIGIFITAGLAFVLSGRQVRFRHGMIAVIGLLATITIGFVYGTTFRAAKGDMEQQGIGDYGNNVLVALDRVGEQGLSAENISFGFDSFAQRVDLVSTLGVVVANHEALKGYEVAYGLDENIWNDITTSFVPRFAWPDKPLTSNPRRYSELYFNFGESAFAITPFGDLLRNYGLWGVFIGMAVIGLILRFIYRSLIEGQPFSVWRATMYFMLLTCVSYEGFYGNIIVSLVRVGATATVGVWLVSKIAKWVEEMANFRLSGGFTYEVR
jgi:hypothetical protein